jgi:glutathione S-transferase
MKLFYVPGTCSLSPHIVSREAGLPVELKKVDRTTKQIEGGGDYNALNGKGYVPALMLDDGEVLTEGAVIVQYLADQKPESGLAPKNGTIERYRLQEWLNFIATEVHKGFSPLFNPNLPNEARDIAVTRLTTRLDWLVKAMGAKPYLMGETFTVADAYLFTCLRWSERTKFDLSKWPTLASFQKRVADRPMVQEAMRVEGLLA